MVFNYKVYLKAIIFIIFELGNRDEPETPLSAGFSAIIVYVFGIRHWKFLTFDIYLFDILEEILVVIAGSKTHVVGLDIRQIRKNCIFFVRSLQNINLQNFCSMGSMVARFYSKKNFNRTRDMTCNFINNNLLSGTYCREVFKILQNYRIIFLISINLHKYDEINLFRHKS